MPKVICCLLALCVMTAQAQDLSTGLRAAISEHAAAPTPPLLTRKSLKRETPVQFAVLAPDGRFVVSGMKQGLTTALSLLDTATLEQRPLFASDRVRRVEWAGDSSRLYLELDKAVGVLSLATPGKPEYITRLDRVADDYFLGVDAASAEHVFVVRQADDTFTLERISLAGEAETLLTTDKQIDQVIAGATPGTQYLVLHDAEGSDIYQLAGGTLTEIIPCGLRVQSSCELLAWDAQQQALWVNVHGERDLGGLFAWSPATRALTAMHEDPLQKTDLFRTVMRADAPLAMTYDSGLRHYALNADSAAAFADLQARLPGSLLDTTTGANGVWLVKEDSSVLRESRYYLFDGQRLQPILEASSLLAAPAPDLLSRKYAVEYSASDGATIPGWVSFPKGVDIAKAPLVAMIHGGPWGRIAADYSQPTQILVNRGYIVFEPNFRASTGYGRKHVFGANRDFGNGRVQQDITDGVQWLLAQGIGDAARVAIAGGSFGGFAVLSGLAFTPDLYKVGVALMPPADLGATLLYSMQQPSFVYRNPSIGTYLKLMGGDLEDPADMQRLYDQSPLASLDTIRAPLLIVAGADDDRIDIKHVKDYALRLLGQGNALSLLIDEDEGHGFLADEASDATLFLMEQMLALHLGGRKQDLDDEVLRKYLADRLLLNTNPGFLTELDVNVP